ncbi:MAG: hypothetical protein PHW46_04095, partial [Candidatus Omnitrophica bacterium]|nr:hypothetical protein [Candidatus Omnitrophota bacterium]
MGITSFLKGSKVAKAVSLILTFTFLIYDIGFAAPDLTAKNVSAASATLSPYQRVFGFNPLSEENAASLAQMANEIGSTGEATPGLSDSFRDVTAKYATIWFKNRGETLKNLRSQAQIKLIWEKDLTDDENWGAIVAAFISELEKKSQKAFDDPTKKIIQQVFHAIRIELQKEKGLPISTKTPGA